MARVQSLGLHEPSALPYLIAESILPAEPSRSLYKWHTHGISRLEGIDVVEEEVLTTRHCVVWSRSRVIKRVYNLDIEGEAILQAFVTSFPVARTSAVSAHSAENVSDTINPVSPLASANGVGTGAKSTGSRPERFNELGHRSHSDSLVRKQTTERALVVILKSQAHIYYLSGDSHVIPLLFEVGKAWPTAKGFLVQRKWPSSSNTQPSSHTSVASVPGYASSDRAQALHPQGLRPANAAEPPATGPTPPEQIWKLPSQRNENMPRTFSFTEPQSEIGLVVVTNTKQKVESINQAEDLHVLSNEEEILYVSPCDECRSCGSADLQPLHLAVTQNDLTNSYTVWEVKFDARSDVEPPQKRRKVEKSGQVTRRRSSNVFGRATGTTTPTARGHGHLRESFGAMAQSHAENIQQPSYEEPKPSQIEQLAAQLGSDFGDVGVQTRAARRVSSMLARTDLSTGPDRNTISESTYGQPSRKSLSRSMRRGDSLGGFSDRQSFGNRRRSSFPGNGSILSMGTSFLDVNVDNLLDDFDAQGDIDGFGSMGLDNTISEMPREIAFAKVKSISRTAGTSIPREEAYPPRVFCLLSPKEAGPDLDDLAVSVCIMDKKGKELTVINLLVQNHAPKNDSAPSKPPRRNLNRAHARELWRGSGIMDACKLGAGSWNRMLLLRHVRDGHSSLQLEAPWSASFTVNPPSQLTIHDPLSIGVTSSPDRRRETGLGRIVRHVEQSFVGFDDAGEHSRVILLDKDHSRHRIQIHLEPANALVKDILGVCSFVLPGGSGHDMLIYWWEALRWLESQNHEGSREWTALVIVLFSLALPFVDDKHKQSPLTQRRKKTGLLRSSSGSTVDMASWEAMIEQEICATDGSPSFTKAAGWTWVANEQHATVQDTMSPTPSPSKNPSSGRDPLAGKKNTFLVRCVALAREFLQTPTGEGAIGPEGYLPIAMNKDPEHRRTALGTVVLGLHLLREEQKLDIRSHCGLDTEAGQLAPIIAQLGTWLGWKSWSFKPDCYYGVEIANVDLWLFEESSISALKTPPQPFEPPSIFDHAENHFRQRQNSPFPTLLDVIGKPGSASRSARIWQEAKTLTPRISTLCTFFTHMHKLTSDVARVELLFKCGLTFQMLGSLPDGIAAPLQNAIVGSQAAPPASWAKALLELVDRSDLRSGSEDVVHQSTNSKAHTLSTHEAQRDYHSIGNIALETDSFHTWDTSSEADRQSITRLIFGDDRRYQEASKLVNQLRPPVAECSPEPEWTEADLLEAQKELVYHVTRRTLAVSSGRGMMNYSARVPLLTEKVVVPAFTMQCLMKPKGGTQGTFNAVTLSAEKAAFTEDKACWAFFHNGVSSGLMISKRAKGIDTSWILYNKPPELTNRHAGFLFALGLNGHLKSLAKWVAFKYLTPKHTMTSIGLLLGLSASYLGTMDTLITRLLSVHVTRLLPPGAAELNLSPMTQTAGIMGIGLLYCASQHRRMSEVMLSEIENTDPEEGASEEAILRDEGYRLAAGFSLGLINLGQGKRLHSLHDMSPVERLLAIAIGTKNVNLVHVLDRATAGATIALMLIFLKTEDESLARKIDVPDTVHQFDYVRPDLFLLRTVARHLILWSRIRPSSTFIQASLPKAYQHRYTLRSTRYLSTEDMPFFNIVAGICLCIGLRFAGSSSVPVRDLLVAYLDQFIRLTRLPALNYDAKLARNSVRNCQDVVALAAAAVMAGTGDLLLLRRFRSLHGRVDADTPYGSHQAAHMAIGTLFLGGGTYTFGTSDVAVAFLVCAFYPVFPTTVLDNRSHLQAFRHFWVLAAEPRCIVPRDADTLRPISSAVGVVLKDGSEKSVTAPCLLPEFSQIAMLRTSSSEHWEVVLDFTLASGSSSVAAFWQSQSVLLRRRAAYDAPASSVFTSALQAVADVRSVPTVSASTMASYRHGQASNPFEWLFHLGPMKGLDVAEQALILPSFGHGYASTGASSRERILSGTTVDTRLELERGVLNDTPSGAMSSDGLWQLRLLFAWLDGLDRSDRLRSTTSRREKEKGTNEAPMWLRRDVVDALRYRVWQLAAGSNDGNQK